MPRLAIVIPALDQPALLEQTLLSVLENRPKHAEVLVATAFPYADPYDLKDEVCFLEAARGSTLCDCVNAGVAKSQSGIVQILPAGARVDEGWAEAGLRHFGSPKVAAVAPLVLRDDQPLQVLSAGYRRLGDERPWAPAAEELPARSTPIAGAPLWGTFYRRAAIVEAGLFDNLVGDWLAAADLSARLHAAGHDSLLEPACSVTAPAASMRRPLNFAAGAQSLRMLHRNRPLLPGALAAAHGWINALRECLPQCWNPGALMMLLGRAWAAWRPPQTTEYHALLTQLKQAAETRAAQRLAIQQARQQQPRKERPEPESAPAPAGLQIPMPRKTRAANPLRKAG